MANVNANIESKGNLLLGKRVLERRGSISLFKERWLPFLLILVIALALTAIAVLVSVLQETAQLDAAQAALVEKLEATIGSYDENTIVLTQTNEYEAKKMAEELHATLHLSSDGRFAVLYLNNDETILEVCKNRNNREIINRITPNYLAHISE